MAAVLFFPLESTPRGCGDFKTCPDGARCYRAYDSPDAFSCFPVGIDPTSTGILEALEPCHCLSAFWIGLLVVLAVLFGLILGCGGFWSCRWYKKYRVAKKIDQVEVADDSEPKLLF